MMDKENKKYEEIQGWGLCFQLLSRIPIVIKYNWNKQQHANDIINQTGALHAWNVKDEI